MDNFFIHFVLCNITIDLFVLILLCMKRIFKHCLTPRMQFSLWIPFTISLFVPFLPVSFSTLSTKMRDLFHPLAHFSHAVHTTNTSEYTSSSTNQIYDYAISMRTQFPAYISTIFCVIWGIGMFVMLFSFVRSLVLLHHMRRTANLMQDKRIHAIYTTCLSELQLRKSIPLYSSSIIDTPVSTGILRPAIFLPLHRISNFKEQEIRYILLHELMHCYYKDAIFNYCMNIIRILYWFHPLIWLITKEFYTERELACDTSVLRLLDANEQISYGITLLHFVDKQNNAPLSLLNNLSENAKQMKRRILNIKQHQPLTIQKKLRSILSFLLSLLVILCGTPWLSVHASDSLHYQWDTKSVSITSLDLSDQYQSYSGSFVLYDIAGDTWSIYNLDQAVTRIAPNSTYKPYCALFGLDQQIITIDNSKLEWNHESYPFSNWEADQTLSSAMKYSVNWYFDTILSSLSTEMQSNYLRLLQYGNQSPKDTSSIFGMETSLKISPVEQVLLLTRLYKNELPFSTDQMNAVKNSLYITSSTHGKLYGKTGTGRIDEKDTNGWFIGYVISDTNTYIFATNIQASDYANGKTASTLTLAILSMLHLWDEP